MDTTSRPHARSAEAQRKLLNVATAIESEPHRYYQAWWCTVRMADLPDDRPSVLTFDGRSLHAADDHRCTTAFCIGGWDYALHHADADELIVLNFEVYDNDANGEWTYAEVTPNAGTLIDLVRRDFDLSENEAELLTSMFWKPLKGVSVGMALRLIARGMPVHAVTDDEVLATWG